MDMESFNEVFEERYRQLVKQPDLAGKTAYDAGVEFAAYVESLVDAKIAAYHDWSNMQR